jgi:tRNA nucleotidyltransferase (CCA-adding enzyme)
MKIYLVGGAVRDKLLGLPIKERDWVVVGATPEQMLALGYRQVGKEFPVFLHPQTHEEYALARIERKYQAGYKGFTFDTSPDVTLEADLQRRDLTINAMAESEEGSLIDPYHGKEDLDRRVLRHVSLAFSEDPVRILRIGRFLARYAELGFHVAPETTTLMRNMVAAGEVNALVAERVWKELDRALGEKNPEQFFTALAECGALPILFPDVKIEGRGMLALQAAAQSTTSSVIRFAALLHDLPDKKYAVAALCDRYRAPNEYRELAVLTAEYHQDAFKAASFSAERILKLLYALDVFRREKRFKKWLAACDAIAKSQHISFDTEWLAACTQAAKSIVVQELIAQGLTGNDLALRLKKMRIEKIAALVKK